MKSALSILGNATFLILMGVLVRLALCFLIPFGEAPDEWAHFRYVEYLAEEKAFPVQTSQMAVGADDYEYYQPPLFYLSGSLIYATTHSMLGENTPYAIRLWNVLLTVLFFVASVKLTKLLAPGRKDAVAGVCAFLAFQPSLAANGSTVSNDPAAMLLITLSLLAMIRVQETDRPSRAQWIGLAVFPGLALLTKLTALCLAPVLLLTLWRRRFERPALFAALGSVFLFLPWALRNISVYGDPMALGIGNVPWSDRPPFLEALIQVLSQIHQTFWVAFGRYNDVDLDWMMPLWLGLSTLAVIGIMIDLGRERGDLRTFLRPGLVSCSLGFLGLLAISLSMGYQYAQPQGRFLFPVAPFLGIAFGAGVASLLGRRRPMAPPVTAAVLASLLGAAVFSMLAKFYPTLLG